MSSLFSNKSIPKLMLTPSVGLLLVWMIVPLAMTIYFSLMRYNLLSPGMVEFAGFENYYFFLTDSSFTDGLMNTLVLVGSVLLITTVLGTLIAVLVDLNFHGRGIVRVLLISPFFIMPTVSALVWKNLLLNPVSGLFAWLWKLVGLTPVDWFSEVPMFSIIMIVSWQWLPFAILILMTALQSMDREQLDAARMDGAGPLAVFRYLTLPHLSRPLTVVIMIETIFLLSIFAEIFTTTSGGPGNETTNLAYLIYSQALLQFDVGMASAGGLVAVVLANIVAFFLIKMIGKTLSEN
ncbi:MAG: carbohydrate ABC transporter permease [Arenicella sp.]